MLNSSVRLMAVTISQLLWVMMVPAYASDIQALVQPCTMCHGVDGNSANSGVPSIAGITPEYFAHVMDAYKNEGRNSPMMKQFTHTLGEADIAQLAEFYGKQKFVARTQEFDAALAQKGALLHAKYCEKCHENGGRITENNYGILAGQWTPYLRQALTAYLDNTRRVNPMMITKLKLLEQEAGQDGIEQLLHFYASPH